MPTNVLLICYSSEGDMCRHALIPAQALDGYDIDQIDFKRNPEYGSFAEMAKWKGPVEELFERLGIHDRFPRYELPEPKHDLEQYLDPKPSFRADQVVSIGFWY